jgi:HEAT repeat protein
LIRIAVTDPDSAIRIIALRGLAGVHSRQDCRELISRIQSRQYRPLLDEEKDLLFRAIAALGDDSTVPFLRQILRPGWLRTRERRPDWPRAAAALARLATPSALEALQALSRHRRAGLATVCADALRSQGWRQNA